MQERSSLIKQGKRKDGSTTFAGAARPVALTFEDIRYWIPKRSLLPCLGAEEPASGDVEKGTRSSARSSRGYSNVPPDDQLILKGVSGAIKAGQLLAILGSSGAGKTTLLDVLAGRDKVGMLSGTITVNGKPRDKYFKKISGYVTQDDCLMARLTVRETFMLYANLKLPSHVTYMEKILKVESLIERLGLQRVADSRIGSQFQRGISGGEKKRVALGCELITDPSIMFLDEPTTGLDSYNSLSVMEKLSQLAKKGTSVVCTIHQPRSTIFKQFDQLMILSQGNVVYMGPAKYATTYFHSLRYYIKPFINPADFLLDVVIENEEMQKREREALEDGTEVASIVKSHSYSRNPKYANQTPATPKTAEFERQLLEHNSQGDREEKEVLREKSVTISDREDSLKDGKDIDLGSVDLGAAYRESKLYVAQQEAIQDILGQASKGIDEADVPLLKLRARESEYAANWFYQLWILCCRNVVNLVRNPMATYITWFQTVFMALLLGSIYWQMGKDQKSIQDRIGALFFVITNAAFSSFGNLNLFMEERPNFNRERAAGLYSTSAYFVAKNMIEGPFSILFPFTMACVAYYMVGFQTDIEKFGIFVLFLITSSFTAGSLLLMIGALSPNLIVASILSPLTLVLFLLFGGFYVNSANIPIWYIWIKYLSFFKYGYEAFVKNELTGLDFTCSSSEQIGGQCPVPTGEVELQRLGMEDVDIWHNLAILGGMIVGYRILAYFFLRFLYKEKR